MILALELLWIAACIAFIVFLIGSMVRPYTPKQHADLDAAFRASAKMVRDTTKDLS